MAIPKGHKANFETLKRAAGADDLALMECVDAKTGEPVTAICAVHRGGQEYVFTPLAKMFAGNPYKELVPPTAEPA